MGRTGGWKNKAPFREQARTRYHLCALSTIIVWTEKYAREAPWVLSDILRAKRKNGVEGKGRERSRWLRGEDAKRREGERERGRGREGAERTRVLSSGAHTGASRMRRVPRLAESGGAARNERGPAALPAGLALR